MKMKRLYRPVDMNPRYKEYDDYLYDHITGVLRTWQELLSPALLDDEEKWGLNWLDIAEISAIIEKHDESKYSDIEYHGYCNYFYPSPGFEKSEEDMNAAWLHHQHQNPHHPQHWVLHQDDGDTVVLDMPFEYICEMLCDWHSFSLKNPESTAYSWWTTNRDKILVSDATAELIDELVVYLKSPLPSDK